MGELGCWIDSSITRMIQTGIEHSRVPSLRSYLILGQHLLPTPFHKGIGHANLTQILQALNHQRDRPSISRDLGAHMLIFFP